MITPSEIKDYRERLGVPNDAPPDEIKKAYIKLAKIYHPNDYHIDDVEKQKQCHIEFIAIGEAYEFLTKGGKTFPKKMTEEEKFEYFKDLYGISLEDFVRITDIMSKDENPKVRTLAKFIRNIVKFF